MKKIISFICAFTLVTILFTGCQLPGLNQGNNIAINPTQPTATIPTTPTTPTTPARVAMSAADIAAYVEKSVATVQVSDGFGTGFFIDDEGTMVTCFHVIEGVESIYVEMPDGAIYDVEKIVDISPLLDIAILKVKISGNEYLNISQDDVRTGETVYAVGASRGYEGTFSNGIISNASRTFGVGEYIQTTAAISGGNSGGPLVNEYGEVVGINARTRTDGQNLNFAVKIEQVDTLSMDKNWSINQYREWYKKEIKRSYKFYLSYEGEEYMMDSLVNTYQYVTGRDCIGSDSDWDLDSGYVNGYHDTYGVYYYNYVPAEFDEYTEYLNEIGFAFLESEEYADGESFFYYNEYEGMKIDIFILEGEDYVGIKPSYE